MKQAVIFKGATRPACLLGVPIVPFVLICGNLIMFSFIVYVPLVVSLIPVVMLLREVTRQDDQRFRQLALFFKVNLRGCGLRSRFGAVGSLLPVSYSRQKRI